VNLLIGSRCPVLEYEHIEYWRVLEYIFDRDTHLQLGIFDHSDSVLLYHDISLSMVFQLKQQNRKRIKQQNRKRLKKRAKVTFVSIMHFNCFSLLFPDWDWFGRGTLQINYST
jgi:hypothetical protein